MSRSTLTMYGDNGTAGEPSGSAPSTATPPLMDVSGMAMLLPHDRMGSRGREGKAPPRTGRIRRATGTSRHGSPHPRLVAAPARASGSVRGLIGPAGRRRGLPAVRAAGAAQ